MGRLDKRGAEFRQQSGPSSDSKLMPPQSLRDRIVDTAIDLAEREGWEDLRLRKVAERCGVDLADVLSEFRDSDAVANA